LSWEELKKGTLSIGKFEGCEICYDAGNKEFLAYVKEEIVRAKSQQLLERQIKALLEVKFDKVLYVEKYRFAKPEIIQVVKRGSRFFSVQDGKLKPIDSYNLHEYSDAAFKELTELVEQSERIQQRWYRIIDGIPNLK